MKSFNFNMRLNRIYNNVINESINFDDDDDDDDAVSQSIIESDEFINALKDYIILPFIKFVCKFIETRHYKGREEMKIYKATDEEILEHVDVIIDLNNSKLVHVNFRSYNGGWSTKEWFNFEYISLNELKSFSLFVFWTRNKNNKYYNSLEHLLHWFIARNRNQIKIHNFYLCGKQKETWEHPEGYVIEDFYTHANEGDYDFSNNKVLKYWYDNGPHIYTMDDLLFLPDHIIFDKPIKLHVATFENIDTLFAYMIKFKESAPKQTFVAPYNVTVFNDKRRTNWGSPWREEVKPTYIKSLGSKTSVADMYKYIAKYKKRMEAVDNMNESILLRPNKYNK